MTQPIKQDLKCYKGQTFRQNFYFKENGETLALGNMTAKSQIRPNENSNKLTAEFTCSIVPEEGMVCLYIPSDTTANIPSGNYAWDLKMVNSENNEVDYYIRGKFIVEGRVTE